MVSDERIRVGLGSGLGGIRAAAAASSAGLLVVLEGLGEGETRSTNAEPQAPETKSMDVLAFLSVGMMVSCRRVGVMSSSSRCVTC